MSLVQEFESLWNSTPASADVFTFLRQQKAADADQWLAVLVLDQQRRWTQGSPLLVEDYLARLPDRPAGIDWKLQLAIGEFQARRNTDKPLSDEEVSSRFPDLSDTLRHRIENLPAVDQQAPAVNSISFHQNVPEDNAPNLKDVDRICDAFEAAESPNLTETVTYITSDSIGVGQRGRYRLDRVLGEGAFGRVYLGFDEDLQRQVAIKVPSKERIKKPENAEAYLAEARTVASLDHPHIVAVYDMGHTEDGSIWVVSKFIEGSTLEDRIKEGRLPEHESAQLLITVARALQYAHDRRLIHRDIKPANILIEEKTNTPYVADFGLAIREEDYLKQNSVAGTPAYMSPEQVRGEGHRLDGRSDVFSLGVVLYELITEKKPFRGSSTQETLHFVLTQEPRPPRALKETIPAELERICLKALSKQASARYSTAAEFAEDLEQWLKPVTKVTESTTASQVVPKGLRSFDAGDADFFLDLLPGTRNRDGLPESIAFWKQRIEETDAEKAFTVGLIYGPSGCGKSSLVKAGLLPHLSKEVIAVYVEATPEETELRILRGLRKRIPGLDTDSEPQGASRGLEPSSLTPAASALPLTETLTHIRRTRQHRVIIIIDQFEQWLHAHRSKADAELVQALRQCDGVHVQAIVMIRDDFAMAAARFMQSLDISIVQGHNFATVDLFEADHAKNVLIRFGQAFGKLPANSEKLSADEQSFVTDVTNGLAQDGKVVSVRLSLFAEMVKAKRWSLETLQQVGGTEGIGVNFLEETFSSPQANPRHRLHAVAARSILKSLLPELGTDIKGHMRSQEELLEASGYANRLVSGKALAAGTDGSTNAKTNTPVASAIPLTANADFSDLLRILDGELRLITPTDPEGDTLSGSSLRSSPSALRFYQLTHDYLVPSLREWLTRKQKETRRGRAELKLEERAALWHAKPENRYLPSLREWLSIRTLTESKDWTAPQRTLMQRAGRVHGIRAVLATAAVCILIVAGVGLTRQADLKKNQAEATRLVEGLLAADTGLVGTSITNLNPFRTWSDQQLKTAFDDSAGDSNAKLHAGLALVAEGQTVDPSVLEFLQERILTVAPGQFASVRDQLKVHNAELLPVWWQLAMDDQQPAARRFHAACVLADYDPDHANWTDAGFTKFIAEQLVAVSPVYVGQYQELLRPVANSLVPALSEIFKDSARGELAKTLATTLLADYAAQDPATLTALVLVADVPSDKTLFPILQQHQETAVKNMVAVLDHRLEPDWKDAPLDPAWTEPSAAVRAKVEAAHGLISERYAFCQDMPWDTFQEIAETLRASGYRPTRIRPHVSLLPAPSLLPLAGGEGGRRPDEGVANAVAAIFTRDGLKWELQPTVTKDQLPAPNAPAAKDAMLLTDLAALPSPDPAAEPQFVALWSELATADEQRRVLIDVSGAELTAAQAQLTEQGFASQCTISVRTDSAGQRRYTAIISNQGAPSEIRPAYAGFELVHQPQWDVAIAASKSTLTPANWMLETWTKRSTALLLDDARKTGKYALQLSVKTVPFDDVRVLQTVPVKPNTKYLYSGWIKSDSIQVNPMEARSIGANLCIDRFDVAAYQDERSEGILGTQDWTYQTVVINSGERSEIRLAARLGYYSSIVSGTASFDDLSLVELDASEIDDAAILEPEFHQTLQPRTNLLRNGDFEDAESSRQQDFSALWRADVEFESKLLAAAPMTSVAEQLKPLLAQGWRPFAIAVDSSGGARSAPSSALAGTFSPDLGGEGTVKAVAAAEETNKTLVPSPLGGEKVPVRPDEGSSAAATCSLVLHRPLIPDAAKEQLALQQSAAATALLRLNAADKVWPLFQDQPDPRLRSYLLHRLARYNIDPQSLITQLAAESEVTRRRSLILGLGEFAKAKLLSADQHATLTADLAKRYADDPDSGVHGAAEWTLKQLEAANQIAEIRTAFSTGDVIGDRRWYLTKAGGNLTFATLDASDEFLMGSPVSEAERSQGPTGRMELRHRRRIGRRFAIGAHEITVAQFQAFRKQHDFDRTKARELDAPANNINWYDAAAYCNWLSEQEGIPRDQWCYDPDQPFQEGMSLLPDYLQRTGYRLPSEAEWEFACRSGTTTSRYFGETESLLGEYGWYTKTSGDKWMLPVGTLRPNGAGLFDMQGNVLEWCQDTPFYFATDIGGMTDKEQMGKLDNSGLRVLRGGSFSSYAAKVRSANRNSDLPDSRNFSGIGFRASRTLPPVPLTALPPAAGGKL